MNTVIIICLVIGVFLLSMALKTKNFKLEFVNSDEELKDDLLILQAKAKTSTDRLFAKHLLERTTWEEADRKAAIKLIDNNSSELVKKGVVTL